MLISQTNYFRMEVFMRRSLDSIKIKEDANELKRLINQEHHPRKKERLQLLYMIKAKLVQTLEQGAEIIGRSSRRVTDFIKFYETGGLKSLLSIQSPPGRPGSCSESVLNDLKAQLTTPKGYASYGEIQTWLEEQHQIALTYDGVWYIANKKLGGTPKVARPQHIKQNKEERETFETNFPETVKTVEKTIKEQTKKTFKAFRHWFQDESRFGLFTIKRRRITLKGVKPIGPMQHEYKNTYFYSAVEPISGDMFTLELPYFDTNCFQIFLDHFSQNDPDNFHIVWMDQAGVHKAHKLVIPDNIKLQFIPPYSPELNPIERLWEEIKNHLAWKNYKTLEELIETVCQNIKNMAPASIKSLTAYPFIQKALIN